MTTHVSTASEKQMSAFTDGAYGTGKRLSATGFLALGLITFWVYTVLQFPTRLNEHFRRRWTDLSLRHDLSDVEPAALERFRASGFTVNILPTRIAAALFALGALLVLLGFAGAVWGRGEFTYRQLIFVVGIGSTLLFAATLTFMLWVLGAIRRHEMEEVLLYEAGAAAFQAKPLEPSGTLVTRWEGHASNVVLFIVLTLPISFSPTLGMHFFLTGGAGGYVALLPALCFLPAGVFHLWGTLLMVNLYNDHLVFEAAQAAVASGAWPSLSPDAVSGQMDDATMNPGR
jgi:hypothetical protein